MPSVGRGGFHAKTYRNTIRSPRSIWSNEIRAVAVMSVPACGHIVGQPDMGEWGIPTAEVRSASVLGWRVTGSTSALRSNAYSNGRGNP